jgi:hypothetical protein
VEGYEPGRSFDEEAAAIYDDQPRGDEGDAVAFLEQLAAGGPALELAIGTGRIAIPLAARGVSVAGIDISEPMVARLRAKPGGERIPVAMGDFSQVPVSGTYRLVYLVFNSLFNLLSQEEQVRCFENVAGHLEEGGAFVLETFVPGYLHRLRDDQYVDAEAIAVEEVWLDVGRHDPVRQVLEESHVRLAGGGVRVYPIVCRYAWPSELDLMARIAGLRLRERWASWQREPFGAASRNCISVYER